ncbi:MAG: cytidylate kinase-like family protein [Candidatus Eremiobacteraeota bacterium]|nr:cytidylate kinase-like family protein [Candidatus Eremiobacteraeota bacterium]
MIVTISNKYGSGAVDIAARAAALLGYTVVDRQLPVVVAKRMHISRNVALEAEESGRSLGSRLLSSLELATPEVVADNFGQTFDESLLREVQRAVRDYAARGNCIIIGRGSSVILGRRPDVLRVYMFAPREWRIERVAQNFGLDEKTAAAEVDRIDRARRAHLRDWYKVDMGSSAIVDLAIDTSTFGEEGSANLIVAAVHAR